MNTLFVNRFVLERVERLFKEVDGTAEKLEDMVEKRREKLKDIQRIRALEKETEQVRFTFYSQ